MKKILLVDDMPTIIDQARKVVGDRYELITCTSGNEVLEKAQETKPDAILLDMYLADSESFEILKKLKNNESTSGIPVIITSADASVVSMSKAYLMGAADFLKKPFVEEMMFRKIDSQIKLTEIGWKFEM